MDIQCIALQYFSFHFIIFIICCYLSIYALHWFLLILFCPQWRWLLDSYRAGLHLWVSLGRHTSDCVWANLRNKWVSQAWMAPPNYKSPAGKISARRIDRGWQGSLLSHMHGDLKCIKLHFGALPCTLFDEYSVYRYAIVMQICNIRL